MKSLKIMLMGPLFLLMLSCAYSYRENVRSSDLEPGGKLKEGMGYIYGTYGYIVRTPTFFGREPYLALDIVSKTEPGGKEIYIGMKEDSGYFFTGLKPGDYTLVKIIFNMDNAAADSVAVNKDFRIEAGQVFYFGDLNLKVLRTTQPYIWWGIKEINDNYQNGAGLLMRDYSGITAVQIIDGYGSLAASIKPFEKRNIFDGPSGQPVPMHAFNK